MKNLFLSLFLLAGTTMAFANTKVEVKSADNSVLTETTIKSIGKKIDDVKNSCTVTVKTGKRNVTITITCECSQSQACDTAYNVASIGV